MKCYDDICGFLGNRDNNPDDVTPTSPVQGERRKLTSGAATESFCLCFINLGLWQNVSSRCWSATAVTSWRSLLLTGEFMVNAKQTYGLVNGQPGLVQADPLQSRQNCINNKQKTVKNPKNWISENAMTFTCVIPMSLLFLPVINTLQPK